MLFLKRDTSFTERGNNSYQNSWYGRKNRLTLRCRSPWDLLQQWGLAQNSTFSDVFQTNMEAKASLLPFPTRAQPLPRSPRNRGTKLTWHSTELNILLSSARGGQQWSLSCPAPCAKSLLHCFAGHLNCIFHISVLNCTFLQCILLLRPCVYLQSALRMIYIKTPVLTQWNLLHGKVQSHKTFTT